MNAPADRAASDRGPVQLALDADPADDGRPQLFRLCAANIASVMDAAAIVLVVRLTVLPDTTVEVILSPDEADLLGRDLRANARYLASRDPSIDTSRWGRR
ncbi:hypothetical protein [Actinomycetospora straminea]|uniref:Uncharacterized protein n=1 Tax=Actinomycetospora straminea TaxID=663607 RepID=A0ABP9EPR5_9PSEU|nr:hypothetical protein [Actinomycetospora straminea]MDD7935484.1 hypothetical protein [Actinomycetospora straminea]